MPQVDFYILTQIHTRELRDRFVCQLVDKAWHQGYFIYILMESLSQAKVLDEIMWTFKQESFLPHDIYPDVAAHAPIKIGYTTEFSVEKSGPQDKSVLVNLTETVPSFVHQFARTVEIVIDTEETRASGRERYRFYRRENYLLFSHTI